MDKQESEELREYDFALALSEERKISVQEALYNCQYLRNFFCEKIIEGKSVYVYGIGRFKVKKKKFSHCRDFQSGQDMGEKEVSILQFTSAHSLRAQLRKNNRGGKNEKHIKKSF